MADEEIMRLWIVLTKTWSRHQMETFSALPALCAGNSPVTGEFPSQMPVTQSFDVFFDLHLNTRLRKQSWRRGFETPLCPMWRHCNCDITGTAMNVPRLWPFIHNGSHDLGWYFMFNTLLRSIGMLNGVCILSFLVRSIYVKLLLGDMHLNMQQDCRVWPEYLPA